MYYIISCIYSLIAGIFFIWLGGDIVDFLKQYMSLDIATILFFLCSIVYFTIAISYASPRAIGVWNAFQKYHQPIVYIAFILTVIWIIVSIFFKTDVGVYWSVGVFYMIYAVMKYFGFQIEVARKQFVVRYDHGFKIFLISFAVFVILLGYCFQVLGVPKEYRWVIEIVFSLVYIGVGYLIFFPVGSSKNISVYNILSLGVILILGGIFLYQNMFSQDEEENDTVEIPTQSLDIEPEVPEVLIQEVYEPQQVATVYTLVGPLEVGSVGEGVTTLQEVLQKLGYFTNDVTGEFDESTRVALRNALIGNCDWPETTKGIFGPQAQECISNLEILVPKQIEVQQEEGQQEEGQQEEGQQEEGQEEFPQEQDELQQEIIEQQPELEEEVIQEQDEFQQEGIPGEEVLQ